MDTLSNLRNNSAFRSFMPINSYQIDDAILKKGGYVAGLVNDGNTCFMNSVLQSLASSKTLLNFLDKEILSTIETDDASLTENEEQENEESQSTEIENGVEENVKNSASPDHSPANKIPKSNNGKAYGKRQKKLAKKAKQAELEKFDSENEKLEKDIKFSMALKELLEKLNFKYYQRKEYFKTHSLLKSMTKPPNRNIILGYDQEDAQEFFQSVLLELEKNVKSLTPKENKTAEAIPEVDLPENALIGQKDLDKVGTIYIPTEQIDPNSVFEKTNEVKYYTPFKMMTPLDGITVERIGCLQCGENGGLRYSISSGLSLNLPSENIGQSLKLSKLLQNWVKPEIIEGVECNRCALNAVYEHLQNQLKQLESNTEKEAPKKLIDALKDRLEVLQKTLEKPVVDDKDYKLLHTESMVRRCSKSKQILISRPPPLLSIHINRSVFDPKTYTIRKNNSRVLFKTRLNLAPWCCNTDEINLDARLPMSNKTDIAQESSEDENVGGEYYAKLHQRFEQEFEDSDEEEYDDEYRENYSRDVNNYDPLQGELDEEMEEDDEENYIEEQDNLGNTIRRRIEKEPEAQEAESNDESQNIQENVEENEEKENILDSKSTIESGDKKSELSEDEMDTETVVPPPIVKPTSTASTVPAGPLTYSLRSVIVHYGTHNYGHYIAFRKYRNCWWRISDESVYVVDEAEVLSTPGVFMLFYEYDYNEEAGMMNDDIEETEQETIIVDPSEMEVSKVEEEEKINQD